MDEPSLTAEQYKSVKSRATSCRSAGPQRDTIAEDTEDLR